MPFDVAINAFVTFFVVIDPLGVAPAFASLTHRELPERRRVIALRGTVVTGVILLVFAVVGDPFIQATGISLAAFSTASGILLFLIGLEMVFERSAARRDAHAEEFAEEGEAASDPSIVPLAIPLMAGPGAIATILLFMTANSGDFESQLAVIGALVLVLIICFVVFNFASAILARAGETAAQVVSRLMGVILCALAVQFVFDGLRTGLLD